MSKTYFTTFLSKSFGFFAAIMCLSFHLAVAQPQGNSEEQAVMGIIEQLFNGMRAGDSSLVSRVFLPDAQMQTVLVKNGQPELRSETVARFLQAVGTPHDKVWDERIYASSVKIDGHLAVVWTDYRFYLGGQFSHCGVNVFQLLHTAEGWKIFQLCDTRRKDDCGEEPSNKTQDKRGKTKDKKRIR